jgi:signal peptidase II
MRIATITLGLTFALDQALKWWIVVGLDLQNRFFIEVWPGVFNLTMAWNRGVNFGLLATDSDLTRWGLVILSLAISAWVWLWALREGRNPPAQVAAGLLVGGALGNIIDRIVWGAVADFLNVSCCGWRNPFAFNVADIAIFIGAFGLIWFAGHKKSP